MPKIVAGARKVSVVRGGLARAIDALFFRWQTRTVQLRRRTTRPSADDLERLRAGAWTAPPMDAAGSAQVLLTRSSGVRRFEFDSTPPFGQPHDRVARGRLSAPAGRARGAALLVPGALTGAPWTSAERLYTRVEQVFAAAGLAAARLELPLHESRTPAGEISGHEMFQGDLFTYLRALAQAVRDVRALSRWLNQEYGSAGVWGLSLGALIGMLAAEREGQLAWAVLSQPPIRADVAWRSPFSAPMRGHMESSGVTRTEIERLLCALEPSAPPALNGSRILIQAGRWDRLAAEGAEALAARWPGAELRIYDGAHISMLFTRRWLTDGVRFASTMSRG